MTWEIAWCMWQRNIWITGRNHSTCSCFIPVSVISPSSYPIKFLGSWKSCHCNHPELNLTSHIQEIWKLTLCEEGDGKWTLLLPFTEKAELVVWKKNSGIKGGESEFPVCIWKALDSWWLCKILIAVSLQWISILARQVTECWKILAASWETYSQTVHLIAWLDGLRLRLVCSCLCVLHSETAMVHAFLLILMVLSVSIFVSLFLWLWLLFFFFCGCVSVCVSVGAHIQMHMHNFYMFIFPSTLGI